jgi:hypothetical protein
MYPLVGDPCMKMAGSILEDFLNPDSLLNFIGYRTGVPAMGLF